MRDETKMKCVMFAVTGLHQSSDICTGSGGATQYGFRASEEIKRVVFSIQLICIVSDIVKIVSRGLKESQNPDS